MGGVSQLNGRLSLLSTWLCRAAVDTPFVTNKSFSSKWRRVLRCYYKTLCSIIFLLDFLGNLSFGLAAVATNEFNWVLFTASSTCYNPSWRRILDEWAACYAYRIWRLYSTKLVGLSIIWCKTLKFSRAGIVWWLVRSIGFGLWLFPLDTLLRTLIFKLRVLCVLSPLWSFKAFSC